MAKNLVIVESPAKVKTISKFLGDDYIIEASMGHLIDLPKSTMGIDIDKDFDVRYITIRGKGQILNKLKTKAKDTFSILDILRKYINEEDLKTDTAQCIEDCVKEYKQIILSEYFYNG